jgi:hypothetical protein
VQINQSIHQINQLINQLIHPSILLTSSPLTGGARRGGSPRRSHARRRRPTPGWCQCVRMYRGGFYAFTDPDHLPTTCGLPSTISHLTSHAPGACPASVAPLLLLRSRRRRWQRAPPAAGGRLLLPLLPPLGASAAPAFVCCCYGRSPSSPPRPCVVFVSRLVGVRG